MYKPKILLADNDLDFLVTGATFLESAGYTVLKASGLQEARRILEDGWANLAVLDMRLVDDEDEKDVSGLTLAKKSSTSIPIIMMTKFQTWEAVRESLGALVSERPPAIDFVAKQEGMEELIGRIQRAFSYRIHINWNLGIDWKARDALSLVSRINPELQDERRLIRSDELQDLFLHLFYDVERIRIDRLVWERDGRVALAVFSHKEGTKPESYLVVCGEKATVQEEATRFQSFGPGASGENATYLGRTFATTHFAANSYVLAGNTLEKVRTLREMYQVVLPKMFKEALTMLFQKNLRNWHQDKLIHQNGSPEYFYRQRLNLQSGSPMIESIEKTMHMIQSQIPTRGVRIEWRGGKVVFHFGGQSFSYPDPLLLLGRRIEESKALLTINVPGTLTGENILTDETGHTWLTDFAAAGQAPIFWNYVEIEALIRFDWLETTELLRRQELEHSLNQTDFFRPDIRDVGPEVRKTAQTVLFLRKLASRTVKQEVMQYSLGIFFQAASRLAENFSFPPTAIELTRLAHAWLALAMIAEEMTKLDSVELDAKARQTDVFRIVDATARIVMVADKEYRLPPQPFALLKYLYSKADQVCTKEELLQEVLLGKYEENYLHKLVGRIRQILEEDVEQPRYLVTEPNTGYRLITKPK